MANLWFNRGKQNLHDRTLDVINDTIKSALIAAGYTALATHNFMSDVTNELSGTGYTSGFAGSGRQTLGTKAITEDDTNNLSKFTAANLTYASINAGTAVGLVLYKHITSDAASPLIGWVDGGFPVTTNGQNLNVNWSSSGVWYLQ